MPQGKIGDIQVLRGIAIVMVLFCHLSIGAAALDLCPVHITMPLYLGVEIFFVVSGYVITRSLMNDGFHGGRFFIKRVFRLMPALLLFIGLTLLLNRYVQNADLSADGKALMSVSSRVFRQQARGVAFGYLTFLPAVSYANGAMWSLSVEDQFYAGVTILCLLAGGVFRLRAKWSGAVLAVTAAALYACLTGWRLAACGRFDSALAPVQYLVGWRFDLLGLGVVTAFLDRRWGERICAAFRDSGPYCSAFLLVMPVMLAAVCESPLEPAPVLHGAGYVIFGLCFAGLVLFAANGLAFPASRGPLYQCLKFVGDRSYTYYLFHYPMFIIAWLLFQRHFTSAFSRPWYYAFAQCLTVAAMLVPFAEAVHRCIELPFAELGRTIAGRMKPAGSNMLRHEKEAVTDAEFAGEPIVVELDNILSDEDFLASEFGPRGRVA